MVYDKVHVDERTADYPNDDSVYGNSTNNHHQTSRPDGHGPSRRSDNLQATTTDATRASQEGRDSVKTAATSRGVTSATLDHDDNNDDDMSSVQKSSTPTKSPIEAFPITTATYIYAMCAALNSVNLGFDLGVSTNVGPLILDDFDLSTRQLELFLGSLNFWSITGALMSPFLSDRWGRRATLRTAAVGFILGVTVTACAPNFELLMVGRMIVGIGVGVGEAIDPMYIAEIAPAHVRGELVSWAEAGVAVGVVLGFASSLLGVGWRSMLALGTILPTLMLFLATWVLPESPRWLVAHDNEAAARGILHAIYPTDEMVEHVITDMKDSLTLEQLANQMVGWKALFRPSPAIRRMLVVGIGIACIQQAVGIDSIMFYLMFVLKQSGIDSELGQNLALIALGTVKLVFVFVGARKFDHSGRRPMLFLSLGGMAISLLVVSFTFTTTAASSGSLTIVALAFYLAFFSVGLGPGNWVVVSEIFAPSIRAKAMMLAVLPNRLTATIMASTFLSVAYALSWPGFFLLLAGICITSGAFLYLYLPETKGKSLEEMVGFFADVTGDRSILDLEEEIRKNHHLEQQQCELELAENQHNNEKTPSDGHEYGTLEASPATSISDDQEKDLPAIT